MEDNINQLSDEQNKKVTGGDGDVPAFPQSTCPSCGSKNTHYVHGNGKMAYKCNVCGAYWGLVLGGEPFFYPGS